MSGNPKGTSQNLILKSFLFSASDDSFWRISSNCLSSASKNHPVKSSLSHPFWGGNRLGAILSLGSLGRTEIEHRCRQQMELFWCCKISPRWKWTNMTFSYESYWIVWTSACFERLHLKLFTCQAITICPCTWIFWTFQSSLSNKLWICLSTWRWNLCETSMRLFQSSSPRDYIYIHIIHDTWMHWIRLQQNQLTMVMHCVSKWSSHSANRNWEEHYHPLGHLPLHEGVPSNKQ